MPFVRANVQLKSLPITTGIRVSLRAGRKSAPRLTFFITSDRAEALGWRESDKVEVLLGEKSDHGLVRMRKADDGQVELTARKAAHGSTFFQLQLGLQPAFVNRTEKATPCSVEVLEDEDAGTIELVLPKWADETHPDRKAKPAASPSPTYAPSALPQQPGAQVVGAPSTAPRRGRPPKSVTANLMGDPPAGRREMLAKMGEMKG